DFTSDFYFRQSWRDERLSFQKSPGLESMTVGAEVAEKIWVPDTFFANEKSAYFHMATTPNTFLRIGSGGEVFRSIRPYDRSTAEYSRDLSTLAASQQCVARVGA
ncbi:hypothetical protein HPB47_010018, partial [Ixodes persulcatus]